MKVENDVNDKMRSSSISRVPINVDHFKLLLLCFLSLSTQSLICSSYSMKAAVPGRGIKLHTTRYRRNKSRLFAQIHADDDTSNLSNRRRLLKSIRLMPFYFASLVDKKFVPPANAGGLVIFPCKDKTFANNYIFLRAGESLLEEEGVWSTNPLFL